MNPRIIAVSALFAALLVSGAPAYSQTAEWETLTKEAIALYQKGQYGRAVNVAKTALEVAEKTFSPEHPAVGVSLNTLADLYHAQGQYAQAEPLYKRSLAILEKALGPGHPSVATILNNLAVLYEIGRASCRERV